MKELLSGVWMGLKTVVVVILLLAVIGVMCMYAISKIQFP